MNWHDLLFMHWPVSVDALRGLIPSGLSIDTHDGPGRSPTAWLGIVPFRMTGIRHRFLPPIPGHTAFPELNVRTYVTGDSPDGPRPGVWFFSLDAANSLAVRIARATFHLNYLFAGMSCACTGTPPLRGGPSGRSGAPPLRGGPSSEPDWINYTCTRCHRGSPAGEFRARYRPTGPPAHPASGSLEHFLTERYCLYAARQDGRVYRGDIHHDPWPLQPAECEVEVNTMATGLGIDLPAIERASGPPLLHFARFLAVRAWLPVGIAPR